MPTPTPTPTPTPLHFDLAAQRALAEVPSGTPQRGTRAEGIAFTILTWEYDPDVIVDSDLKASILRNMMPIVAR
jgi:hypothetical protein